MAVRIRPHQPEHVDQGLDTAYWTRRGKAECPVRRLVTECFDDRSERCCGVLGDHPTPQHRLDRLYRVVPRVGRVRVDAVDLPPGLGEVLGRLVARRDRSLVGVAFGLFYPALQTPVVVADTPYRC